MVSQPTYLWNVRYVCCSLSFELDFKSFFDFISWLALPCHVSWNLSKIHWYRCSTRFGVFIFNGIYFASSRSSCQAPDEDRSVTLVGSYVASGHLWLGNLTSVCIKHTNMLSRDTASSGFPSTGAARYEDMFVISPSFSAMRRNDFKAVQLILPSGCLLTIIAFDK